MFTIIPYIGMVLAFPERPGTIELERAFLLGRAALFLCRTKLRARSSKPNLSVRTWDVS